MRNTTHEPDGSFFEADHLDGDTDVIGVMATLMAEEERRAAAGTPPAIPLRPDHGHLMMNDIGTRVNSGHSGIGRMRGLAELRGVRRTVEALRRGSLLADADGSVRAA